MSIMDWIFTGIIILLERPVRIGDTVTIGTISGTVNKIRIRSTTLTDFDRKEVIIPNQQLMIERLINWSLSDAITRVRLRIRIGLTQNPKQVQQLLVLSTSTLMLTAVGLLRSSRA